MESVAVVGAGFMGSGIAESVARAGLDVVLHEPERAALDRSRSRIEESVERAVRNRKLDGDAAHDLLARISWTEDLGEVAGRDVVVEAVFEDLKVKGPLFRTLDELLPETAILASNTSSIPIAELASFTQHPERVLGLHFFSPVPVMRLVEVVSALDTSEDGRPARGGVRAGDRQAADPHEGPRRVRREPAAGPVSDVGGPDARGGLRVARGHRHRHAARRRAPDGPVDAL